MAKTIAPDVPQAILDLANMIWWEKIDEAEQRRGIGELESLIGKHLSIKDPRKAYGGAGGQKIRNAVPQWVLDKLSAYDYSNVPTNKLVVVGMRSVAIAKLRQRGVPLISD